MATKELPKKHTKNFNRGIKGETKMTNEIKQYRNQADYDKEKALEFYKAQCALLKMACKQLTALYKADHYDGIENDVKKAEEKIKSRRARRNAVADMLLFVYEDISVDLLRTIEADAKV